MTIFGKRLSEYVAFSKLFIGLVFVVGIARLALSLGGVPNSTTRWLSMTAVMWIGVVYYSIRVHTSGFGSYRHLLPVLVLPNFVAQTIASIGIVISIITGNANVFSAPEFAFGADGRTWIHFFAHVFIGTTIGSLFPWLVGCLFMFITRKLTRERSPRAAVRA
jgi:hypothetical protein